MTFDLKELGWDDRWAAVFAPFASDGLVPARVAIEFNHIFRLYAEAGELQAQHAGRLLHEAESKEQLSAVGDWIAARQSLGEATATIEAVLPRRSRFSRKVAGESTEEQVVAANIDTVFIVMGLDGDYNPRRLERYLLLAYESGATPVVILNKSDVADHLSDDVDEIRGLAIGIPVHAISARTRSGIEVVEATWVRAGPERCWDRPGWGSPRWSTRCRRGVAEDQRCARQRLSRPAHHPASPTHRPAGASRPAGGHARHARAAVVDAGEVARHLRRHPRAGAGCHFTDCRHRDEPRCAVKRAVEEGTLAADRLEGYLEAAGRAAALETRKNVRAQIDEKRRSRRSASR